MTIGNQQPNCSSTVTQKAPTNTALALCQRLEAFLKEPAEKLRTESHELVRLALHELKAHQIELERKDEELRQARVELRMALQGNDALNESVQVGKDSVQAAKEVAQAKTNTSQAQLRGLVDTAMDAIIMVDANMCVVLYNKAAANLFGVASTEALGASLDRFIPARYQPEHGKHMRKFAEKGNTARSMGRLGWVMGLRSNGEEFPAEASISHLVVEGQVLFSVIIRDLTDRNSAETFLLESNEKFQMLIDHAPAALAMFDRQMRYIVVSARWMTDYGMDGQDVIGRSHYEIFPDIPESWKTFHLRGMAGEVLRDDESRFDRLDGSVQWLRWEIRPWHTGDQDIGGIVIFSEDITERKRVEAQLQNAKDALQATLDASPDLVFVVDLDGRYLDFHSSRSDLLIAPAQAFIGRLVSEVMPADVAAIVMATLQEANGCGHAAGAQIQIPLSGGLVWFELSAAREPPREGVAPRFVVFSRDITARKHGDECLAQALACAEMANGSKSRFLAAASHDLRQPMAALALYAGMLGTAVKPGQEKLVSLMQNCVDSLSRMLNDLLDVSKLDAGAMVPKISVFSMDDLCTSLQSIYDSKAANKGLRLRFRHGDHITLRTDQPMLHRLIGNLVDNAVAYTEQGGVLVATRRYGGKLRLEVWDTGVGMAQDQLPLIFEEFRQLGDNARNRGSGLGLAIATRMAGLLGLEIRVRSRPGRGSVFSITLPEGGTLAPIEAPAPAAAQAFIIGLVEDNKQVLDSLVLTLQGLGHTVFAGTSGAKLLEQLGQMVPDVVISDYQLGAGETAMDVIALARARFGPKLPAIVITGNTAPNLMQGKESGIAVLIKPMQMGVLQAALVQATGENALVA